MIFIKALAFCAMLWLAHNMIMSWWKKRSR